MHSVSHAIYIFLFSGFQKNCEVVLDLTNDMTCTLVKNSSNIIKICDLDEIYIYVNSA
jgi:predicted NodU family carbamoyl transferase